MGGHLINKNILFTFEKFVKVCQGRYVIITGFLYGEHIMILCVYAPNVYQEEFFSKFLAYASAMSATFSILEGDFNCVKNPEVDQHP